MATKDRSTLKSFFKAPGPGATAAETQIKIGKDQYDETIESALNLLYLVVLLILMEVLH